MGMLAFGSAALSIIPMAEAWRKNARMGDALIVGTVGTLVGRPLCFDQASSGEASVKSGSRSLLSLYQPDSWTMIAGPWNCTLSHAFGFRPHEKAKTLREHVLVSSWFEGIETGSAPGCRGGMKAKSPRRVCVRGWGPLLGSQTVSGLAGWVVQRENHPLEKGLANFLCEGPESKPLRLCGPHSVCSNLSTVVI